MKTTVLDTNDIRQIVHRVGLDALMDQTIFGLADAIRTFDSHDTVVPVRGGLKYSRPEIGLLEWMPALRAGERAAIKIVGYHPFNPSKHDLPTIISTISMYCAQTGSLLGLADATFLTALRTGAASAVASRIMAAGASSRLGIIGCGAQAVAQLHALSRVFDLRHVFIHDTNPAALSSFPDRVAPIAPRGLELHAAAPKDFVAEVDILCTATSVAIGEGPVFEDQIVRPHLHVNAVGSDFPGKIELPVGLLHRSHVCPDYREQAAKEGECQQLLADQIGPDLAEMVKHERRYTRLHGEPTVFDSTGWALEDLVALEIILAHARDLGIGSELELESHDDDCLNPYGFLKLTVSRPAASAIG